MKVEEAAPSQIEYVVENMRQSDKDEFFGVSEQCCEQHMLEGLKHRSNQLGLLCVSKGHKPVCIGGLTQVRPGVASLMLYATEDFNSIAISLTRFVTKRLMPEYKEAGFHRFECLSSINHVKAHRWIKQLGLHEEAALEGFGRNGETYILFSWVADHVRAPRH